MSILNLQFRGASILAWFVADWVRITAGSPFLLYREYKAVRNHGAVSGSSRGLQEGQSVDLSNRTFDLLIRQPVEFPLFVSSFRTTINPEILL